MVKYIVLAGLVLLSLFAQAQDSLPPAPSADTTPRAQVVRRAPVVRRLPVVRAADSTSAPDSLTIGGRYRRPVLAFPSLQPDSLALAAHPYLRFTNPVRHSVSIKQWQGKEAIFYAIILLLLFFALIRNGFHRYISDLFKIFFHTTVNQRQTRDQLLQSPLPSLLLNVFFLLSIGMFVALVLPYFHMGTDYNFWLLFLYCVGGLAAIYGIKYVSLKLLGWVFQVSEAVDSYIFIVFTTNKVIGVALLPFLVLLAFTYGFMSMAALNLALLMVVVLFAYRYFLSYVSIHRQVRIHFFHFLLYLMAFELVPLLLINKLLFSLLGETY